MAAAATSKALRGDEPDEVARICRLLDERCGFEIPLWADMLAGLAEDSKAPRYPVDGQKPRYVELPAVPSPDDPFWMR